MGTDEEERCQLVPMSTFGAREAFGAEYRVEVAVQNAWARVPELDQIVPFGSH